MQALLIWETCYWLRKKPTFARRRGRIEEMVLFVCLPCLLKDEWNKCGKLDTNLIILSAIITDKIKCHLKRLLTYRERYVHLSPTSRFIIGGGARPDAAVGDIGLARLLVSLS
ncbi:hypothetical protein EVAR_68192_1 [Eumeta japonica]|uniref:Uncharacterized protein n=1 Tax=Eumeta variegata TaxID=151549 RepID=A0A4C2A3E6_EUMVA|nr:hypothetical protein EVAR_68192_1 [Eumeta japonica]